MGSKENSENPYIYVRHTNMNVQMETNCLFQGGELSIKLLLDRTQFPYIRMRLVLHCTPVYRVVKDFPWNLNQITQRSLLTISLDNAYVSTETAFSYTHQSFSTLDSDLYHSY